jgi:hypothetical protein
MPVWSDGETQNLDNLLPTIETKATILTCYFRHMKLIFEQIGIEVTPENKKEIDRKIHGLVGVPYKNCPEAWKAIKNRMAEDEEKFVADLDRALA